MRGFIVSCTHAAAANSPWWRPALRPFARIRVLALAEATTRGVRVIGIGGSGSPVPIVDPGIAPLIRNVATPRNLAKSVTAL